jgi:cytochrome P450
MHSLAERYGDYVTFRAPGHAPMVFVSDPEAIQQVFAASADELHAGEGNAILLALVGPNSLLLLDGSRHRRERKLLMPPFHGERMQAYADVMRQVTDRVTSSWRARRKVTLLEEFQRITLDIILHAVFGLDEGAAMEDFRDLMRQTLQSVARPAVLMLARGDGTVRAEGLLRALGPLVPWNRFQSWKAKVDARLHSEIRARRRRPTGGVDILSLLLSTRDEKGGLMGDDELHDEMMTLVVAGHETTAVSLTWTVYLLLTNPDALARARAELRKVVGDRVVTARDVPQLEYLDACIKESMRLQPVLPLVARVVRGGPYRLGPYELPEGTAINPCIYLTHRRPDLWSEPARFRPERFLDAKPPPHHFFPFGGGLRRCIGMAFAQFEMKIVLAQLLRHDMKLPNNYRGRMRRRGITFAIEDGLPLTFG